MLNVPVRAVFDVITDFLATNPPLEELLKYQLPDDLQARAEWLLERNTAGELSYAEEQELMDFVRANQMIRSLKIKIRLKMQDDGE